jgi:hypothetical protein
MEKLGLLRRFGSGSPNVSSGMSAAGHARARRGGQDRRSGIAPPTGEKMLSPALSAFASRGMFL